jgi:hypothetical protein
MREAESTSKPEGLKHPLLFRVPAILSFFAFHAFMLPMHFASYAPAIIG